MTLILSTFLFAAAATAEMTTSMWIPSPYNSNEIGFYGSVVDASGDRVTMALSFDNETGLSALGYEAGSGPETVTFIGSTSFEVVTTTTEVVLGGALTLSFGCSMKDAARAKPTCQISSNGPALYSEYCSDREDGNAPDYCSSGSTLPASIAVQTIAMQRAYVQTLQIVVTAGEEKLSATAGASLSTTSASATSATSATPTGSAAIHLQGYAEQISKASTATAVTAPVSTGAAPMVTIAPALVGLGAAVAAFVL